MCAFSSTGNAPECLFENRQPRPACRDAVSWSRGIPLTLTPQPRYLGLDVGSKRIGVAVSDALGLTAQPVMTLERRRNPREDLRSLARLCRKYEVVGIVVGNPLHISGEVSNQAAKIQHFAAELGTLSGLPIHLWDERLTSREAHQILYQAGHARQDHKQMVDQVAATLILRDFLEGLKSREQGNEGTGDEAETE
jgi:putative Holliday junction resolvase